MKKKLSLLGHVRLLPIVIAVALLTFSLKIGDLWQYAPFTLGGVKSAEAQQQATGEEAKEEITAGDDEETTASNGEGEKSAATQVPEEEAEDGDAVPPRDASDFTRSELEILQRLATRREQLKARGRELGLRENLLKAAEQQIEEKIAELKKIEATIRDLLKKHDEEQETKLRRIVKVYENMKPKQAAPIFNQLNMELLLDVAERMREAKIAPILALMKTEKARDVSTLLAKRRQLPQSGAGLPRVTPAPAEQPATTQGG